MKLDKYSLMQAAGLNPSTDLINEGMLNEDAQWPVGHFVVVNTFEITPGGGWSYTFDKGWLLRVTNVSMGQQRIEKWDALKNDWKIVHPPIQSYRLSGTFPSDGFQGSNGWVPKFTQNTKKLSQSQADSMAKSMAKETVLSARDAMKMLGDLPPNTQVKITII